VGPCCCQTPQHGRQQQQQQQQRKRQQWQLLPSTQQEMCLQEQQQQQDVPLLQCQVQGRWRQRQRRRCLLHLVQMLTHPSYGRPSVLLLLLLLRLGMPAAPSVAAAAGDLRLAMQRVEVCVRAGGCGGGLLGESLRNLWRISMGSMHPAAPRPSSFTLPPHSFSSLSLPLALALSLSPSLFFAVTMTINFLKFIINPFFGTEH